MKQSCAVLLAVVLLCSLSACAAAGEEITVVSREEGSGTRSAFVALTGVLANGRDKTTLHAEVSSSTAVVMQTVAGDRNAIGYISLGALDGSVRAVSIDGVFPTNQAIRDGSYPLARPFFLTAGRELTAAADDFMRFLRSDEAQVVIERFGCVPIGGSGGFRSAKPRGRVVVEGSSSVAPVMEKLAEAYMALNPGVQVELQADDSSTGLAAAAAGLCDIGMSSRAPEATELAGGLTAMTLCMDGIAVIVNRENPVSDLQLGQLAAIFRGDLHSWAGLRSVGV